MKEAPIKEFQRVIEQAKDVLLIARGGDNGDEVASLLAMRFFLEGLGKRVRTLAVQKPSRAFSFLEGMDGLMSPSHLDKRFTILLDTSKTAVEKLSYEATDDLLKVFVTSRDGVFKREDVSFQTGSLDADVVVTLGIESLGDLGELHKSHAALFEEAPVIQIGIGDEQADFADVQIVDPRSTSLAEVLTNLFTQFSNNKIDQRVATALLTGIIYRTNSFQNASTTPKSFTISAQLVARGADQQRIVQALFKTKSLPLLKLWGRVLARITRYEPKRVLWSLITKEDFAKTGTSPSHLGQVIHELEQTAEDAEFFVLLYEKEDDVVGGVVRSQGGESAAGIAKLFGGSGDDHEAEFSISGRGIRDVDQFFLQHLEKLNNS